MTGEWLRAKRNQWEQQKVRRAKAVPLTDDLRATARTAAAESEKPVYEVHPYHGDGGVRQAMDLLDGMHEVRRKWFRNVTNPNVFEIAFDRGDLTFRVVPGDREHGAAFRDQLYNDYPNSELRQMAGEPPGFADSDHTHIAAANGHLHRDPHLPIRHIDVDGFAYSDEAAESRDPYQKVLTKLTTDDDATVWLQTAFRPATQGLLRKRAIEQTARALESGGYRWIFWKRPPREHEKAAAETVRAQLTESLFQVGIRVVAAADSAEAAKRRVVEAARGLSEYYESSLDQGIYFAPVASTLPFGGEGSLSRFVGDVAARKATLGEETATTSELAGLAHLPEESVTNPAIAWSRSKAGPAVPPGFPDFDLDDRLDDPALATPAEKWKAMLHPDEQEPGAPWAVGFGARKGAPVGIYDDDYHHTARGGETRYGKTESALHDFYQACARGHTAIYIDPKSGDDANTAARYAMRAGRGDEIYPIRLGSESDHQLGFNLLEVPGNPDLGTKRYGAGLESMADIVEGALRQADAQSSGQWGSRMSRITRHLCRALGKMDLGHPPTPLTLYYAGTNREKYAEHVDGERLNWLRETAQDVFAEYSDEEIEPWRGRMQQIIESDPLREMACLTSSLSFFDLFHRGGVVIIYAENTSQTAMKMLMSGFFPRAYREFTYQYRHPEISDPTEAHLFADELNDIITGTMDFPRMLSNGAGYGFHVHGIMQDYDSQAGEEVEQAFKGQARNITLNTGTPEFAATIADLHDGFNTGDLARLPKFTAVVSAHDKRRGRLGEPHSVKTKLGPPLHEIDDAVPRAEAAEAHLVERERVAGEEVRSPEEVMAETPFSPGYDGFDDSDGDDLDVTEAVERAAAQAVYDTACRAGDPSGYVALPDAAAAIRRRVARLEETPADTPDRLATEGDVYRRVVQHIPTDVVERRDRDGEHELRAASPRSTIATVGEDKSAGGATHAGLLWDSYRALSSAGADVEVREASGDDPDGVVRAAPLEEQNAPGLVAHLVGDAPGDEARLEAEAHTGDSKPGATVRHILQAAEEGRRCVAIARPGTARNVAETVYAAPALCRSNASDDEEVRFYTSPRDVYIGEDQMTRPGSSTNVWVREDGGEGDVVLRDGDGTEHARFPDPEAVFTDREAYPEGGDTTIKRPVIPDTYDGEPDVTVLVVPEGAETLGDLSVVVDETGATIPADAVGRGAAAAAGLDVPDRAARLLHVLRERGAGTVTKREAHDLASDHGGDLDVSRRTVNSWVNALRDEGVLEEAGTDEHGAATLEVR